MKTLVFATNNKNKLRELNTMSESEGVRLIALSDIGLILVPEETGTTFEENALHKARETAALLKENGHEYTVLSDDSGIEIDVLDGILGVDSANFMGTDTPYTERNEKILEMLKNVPEEKRTARFVCIIACVLPGGGHFIEKGVIEGLISREQRGENGFGYDPIFFVPSFNKTTAELSQAEKNKISHRGSAFRKMLALLKKENLI